MKKIRKVSQKEMENNFPDLMNAIFSPEADYCGNCDGLRLHHKEKGSLVKCTVCGSVHNRNRMDKYE